MYNFKYHKPNSVAEAKDILINSEDGKVLAGGQTLIATMKLRLAAPTDVVDLKGVAKLTEMKRKDGKISIGSMVTHSEVASSDIVKSDLPGLAHLASEIGDQMVRNVGTIGGSVANNDPAADYPAALLALGTSIVTNKRTISSENFFTGMYETCLEPHEIIEELVFPLPKSSAYCKFKNPASRYAIVGVMVAEFQSGVRVAVTGAGSSVFRASKIEDLLNKSFSTTILDETLIADDDLISDMHASAKYRAHLITVMAKRAVGKALESRDVN